MGWSKDTSQSPKVIYTTSDAHNSARRIVYDPSADEDKRVIVESRFVASEGETVADIDAALGIG